MIVNIYFFTIMRNILEWFILWWCPCLEKKTNNTRQSEIEISHNIIVDPSMNVCVMDEILSPMYDDGKCKSPSFRLSYDQSDDGPNEMS